LVLVLVLALPADAVHERHEGASGLELDADLVADASRLDGDDDGVPAADRDIPDRHADLVLAAAHPPDERVDRDELARPGQEDEEGDSGAARDGKVGLAHHPDRAGAAVVVDRERPRPGLRPGLRRRRQPELLVAGAEAVHVALEVEADGAARSPAARAA